MNYDLFDKQKWALDELNRILVSEPGRLQVITAQHLCGCTENGSDPVTAEQLAICQKYSEDVCSIKQPGHFACWPVVRLSEPNGSGVITAYYGDGGKNGDATGNPHALLKRLLQPFEAHMNGFNLPELVAEEWKL